MVESKKAESKMAPQKILTQFFSDLKIFPDPNFFGPTFFSGNNFFSDPTLNLDVRISFFSIMYNSGGNFSSKFIGKSKSRYQVWPSSAQLVYFIFYIVKMCFPQEKFSAPENTSGFLLAVR